MVKVWKKSEILALLDTNDIFLERSLVKMFERQTQDEKAASDAKHENGMGFNKPDANRCTILAKTVLKRKGQGTPEGMRLEQWQREMARLRLRKYASQLLEIANAPKKEVMGKKD